MKKAQKFLAAILLASVLGVPAFAGDMPAPPNPNPAPIPSGIRPQGVSESAAGDLQAPPAPDDFVDTTTLVFNLLLGVLSIY